MKLLDIPAQFKHLKMLQDLLSLSLDLLDALLISLTPSLSQLFLELIEISLQLAYLLFEVFFILFLILIPALFLFSLATQLLPFFDKLLHLTLKPLGLLKIFFGGLFVTGLLSLFSLASQPQSLPLQLEHPELHEGLFVLTLQALELLLDFLETPCHLLDFFIELGFFIFVISLFVFLVLFNLRRRCQAGEPISPGGSRLCIQGKIAQQKSNNDNKSQGYESEP